MKDTPVNRFYVRARCAKFGLPVPEWARKQKRGRPYIHPVKPAPMIRECEPPLGYSGPGRPVFLTPEERKYKKRAYNHAYYMRVTKKKRKMEKRLAAGNV